MARRDGWEEPLMGAAVALVVMGVVELFIAGERAGVACFVGVALIAVVLTVLFGT